MDSALKLRIAADKEAVATRGQAEPLLRGSDLVQKLTADIAFPASYQVNVVELLDLARLTSTLDDERCSDALAYACDKRTKDGYWKIDYAYKADGYVSFDRRGARGDWVSYLLGRCVERSGA